MFGNPPLIVWHAKSIRKTSQFLVSKDWNSATVDDNKLPQLLSIKKR